MLRVILLILGLLIAGCSSSDDSKKTLVIYTHSSFLASYGPGASIAKAFEKKYDVSVKMIDAGDASLVLQRLKLDHKSQVDVVIGFDQLSKPEAEKLVQWVPVDMPKVKLNPQFPVADWGPFVPYDWAPLTFVYKKERIKNVSSWKDLLKPELEGKLTIQDPRLSTPGLQFLFAVKATQGEEYFNYLNEFKKNVYRVAPSWSSSYGLFQKGKASAVFSYLTSPVYHWINDGDRSYQAVVLEEGHPVQVELAGVPRQCKNCEERRSL
ncbi:MAG: thiamine ABC transporter substrate-binding protein [Bdellovibrionales bacterium]